MVFLGYFVGIVLFWVVVCFLLVRKEMFIFVVIIMFFDY